MNHFLGSMIILLSLVLLFCCWSDIMHEEPVYLKNRGLSRKMEGSKRSGVVFGDKRSWVWLVVFGVADFFCTSKMEEEEPISGLTFIHWRLRICRLTSRASFKVELMDVGCGAMGWQLHGLYCSEMSAWSSASSIINYDDTRICVSTDRCIHAEFANGGTSLIISSSSWSSWRSSSKSTYGAFKKITGAFRIFYSFQKECLSMDYIISSTHQCSVVSSSWLHCESDDIMAWQSRSRATSIWTNRFCFRICSKWDSDWVCCSCSAWQLLQISQWNCFFLLIRSLARRRWIWLGSINRCPSTFSFLCVGARGEPYRFA